MHTAPPTTGPLADYKECNLKLSAVPESVEADSRGDDKGIVGTQIQPEFYEPKESVVQGHSYESLAQGPPGGTCMACVIVYMSVLSTGHRVCTHSFDI